MTNNFLPPLISKVAERIDLLRVQNNLTMRELALTYDVYGYPFEITGTKEGFVKNSIKILLEDGKISKGDLVGFIGGSFNDVLGATYMEFKYV